MLIQISLIPQYITCLDCHALSWTLAFNQVLEVHPNRSHDLVLEYMLVTPHLMQDQLYSFLIHRQDTCNHNFMCYPITTSQQFHLWRKPSVCLIGPNQLRTGMRKSLKNIMCLPRHGFFLMPNQEKCPYLNGIRMFPTILMGFSLTKKRSIANCNVSQILFSTGMQPPVHVGLSDYSDATGISQNEDYIQHPLLPPGRNNSFTG